MGQILSDEGHQDEAINCLIDALRWDAKNGYALLMMGNIFAKFHKDIPTALKYYDQALIANPDDYITINNIAANLLQQGKPEEARKFFLETLRINHQYPNAHMGMAKISEMEGDLPSAFYSTIQSVKLNSVKNTLYQNAVRMAFEVAKKIVEGDTGKKIFRDYRHKLEYEGETKIDIVQDETIPTAAKIEFAENYNRDQHIVRYKPGFPAVEHLIMHELVHLDFVIQARKAGLNQLFVSYPHHRESFIRKLDATVQKLRKMGVPEKAVNDYCNGLFDGLNSQIYNTPIDLFIEDFLYNEFPELQAFQFLSLHNLVQNGLRAVTDKKITEISPKEIVSKSKVYNLVNALQFRELYGVDVIDDFKASVAELRLANDFFKEYQEYRNDREAAEEYELITHWAEDLQLHPYFELVPEAGYHSRKADIDSLLASIENDPFDLETEDPVKEREMRRFQKSQQRTDTNMEVVMYMMDALQFFKGKPQEEIKKIAYEIAMLGTQGFSPAEKGYRITSIPGKTFSGYHILAYYYVSWALAIPEMLPQLGLPYEQEFEMAKSIDNH